MTARARPFTPAKLAEAVAQMLAQGVPVKRAKLTADGALDIEIGARAESDELDLDLRSMKR